METLFSNSTALIFTIRTLIATAFLIEFCNDCSSSKATSQHVSKIAGSISFQNSKDHCSRSKENIVAVSSTRRSDTTRTTPSASSHPFAVSTYAATAAVSWLFFWGYVSYWCRDFAGFYASWLHFWRILDVGNFDNMLLF